MAAISTGDMARSLMLQRNLTAAKADVARHSAELATGRVADAGRALAGDYGALAAVEASLARIDGWSRAGAEAETALGAMQAALEAMGSGADAMAGALMVAFGTGDPRLLGHALAEGRSRLEGAVAALNVRLADRSLFAGAAGSGPALAGADAMLEGLRSAMSAAQTPEAALAALDHWFDGPDGFVVAGYLGSDVPAGPYALAPGDVLSIGVTAADPGLRATLKPLALATLLSEGLFAGDAGARDRLARAAAEGLMAGAGAHAGVAARLGVMEERVAAAQARNGAEGSALTMARARLVEADPYAAATALEAAQTRLETLYAVTARLSRLSLVDFLR